MDEQAGAAEARPPMQIDEYARRGRFALALGNLLIEAGVNAYQALLINPDRWFDLLVVPVQGAVGEPEMLYLKVEGEDGCCDEFHDVQAIRV